MGCAVLFLGVAIVDNTVKKTKQVLLIEDRKRVELNDVESILSFEEEYITLLTSSGKIQIEGEGMRIIDLSKETGHISIVGKVDSILYGGEDKKRKIGLFK